MELLVTVDKNYIPPLQVMLTSLYMNNPGEDVELYLLHSKLQEKESKYNWRIIIVIEKQAKSIVARLSLYITQQRKRRRGRWRSFSLIG